MDPDGNAFRQHFPLDDEENVPKLLSIGTDVRQLLDDPPDTLPSFVVENNGEWMCRKCKGRKFYEAHNHRIFYYDGKWRRRCASCAGKVRQRQRQGKRKRDYLGAASGSNTEKKHIPIHQFASDPHDRVIPLKSAPSQRKEANENVQIRHSVIHVPTKDIVASPGSYEIRENQKKHILLYGPIQPLCYQTAEKTVGGVIYDVLPLIRVELAPLTSAKFSIRLSSVHAEKETESEISDSPDEFTMFLLRWDKDNVQLWQGYEPMLSTPLRENKTPLECAGPCTTVRSNIPNLRLAVTENHSFEEPIIERVHEKHTPAPENCRGSTSVLVLEGSGLGSAGEAGTGTSTDQWAAKALKAMQGTPHGASPHGGENSLWVSSVKCGTDTLSVLSSCPTRFMCERPRGTSAFFSVWVPRRVTRDGFQHEVTPHIQVLNTNEKIKMRDAKELLGPLKDWTVSNFATILPGNVSNGPSLIPDGVCESVRHGAQNAMHLELAANKFSQPIVPGCGPLFITGKNASLKDKGTTAIMSTTANGLKFPSKDSLDYPAAVFPKVSPSACQVMGANTIPLDFQVIPKNFKEMY
eukprot:gb/GECG01007942.1/.p1 GENE.gb/GECG01007942.1/~~gb/GECG01007942.1/.p1  ORF type:complete len:579 (+),score=59.83 gb/GECG01007942.1/:1-1737(+)